MSVWSDIDDLKKKHDEDMATTRSTLFEAYGKRTSNSLKITEAGSWRVLHEGVEFIARTSAELLAKLPKPKVDKPKHSMA